MMKLQLERPLVFFDLETTGVNIATDRIVEISLLKMLPSGECEPCRTLRVKPTRLTPDGHPEHDKNGQEIQMHIPEGASAVHHIYDEDLVNEPTFGELAPQVIDYLRGCDLAGYNSNHFDVPLLQEELLRAGMDYDLREESKFIDAFVIFQKHTPRNLTAAYMHYCGKNLEDAHSADADTMATYEVLMAQMQQHADLPASVEALAQYTTQQPMADLAGRVVMDEQGRQVINFGKYKGQPIAQVFATDPGYYSWLMNSDFPLYTKRVFRQVMDDIKSQRREQRRQEQHQPATDDQLELLRQRFGKNEQGTLFPPKI